MSIQKETTERQKMELSIQRLQAQIKDLKVQIQQGADMGASGQAG